MQLNVSSNFTSVAATQPLVRSLSVILVIIIGTTGHVLVLLAIYRYGHLRSFPNLIISNLSVSDLLFCIIVVPLNKIHILQGRAFPNGTTCKMAGATNAFFSLASTYTLAFISVERFLATNYPLKHRYKFDLKLVRIGLVCIWCWSTFFSALPFAISRYVYVPSFGNCTVDWSYHVSTALVYFVVGYAFPLVILIYCNAHVLRAIRKAQPARRIHLTSFRKPANATCRFQREIQVSMMTFPVVVTFILCWTPYTIVAICLAVGNCTLSKEFMSAAPVLVAASSGFNPIIYGVMNKNFRKVFWDILCCERLGTRN